ncbi:hypothetical protein GCM10027034_12890 [Ramlibacter solisilvae]|uniref:hypothetical protein n=1 Tax=Ramlibacter tataouinensis TaxID=94132 RepID=UPI000777BD97|nr:hypothetical protein [Ramlibacter tataouinensis]
MALDQNIALARADRPAAGFFLASWPLLTAVLTYAYLLAHGASMLLDGDTHWHVATGRWILEHGVVPQVDPFSHTMRGSPWTAHEWLSDVALAWVYQWGGWTFVTALAAFAFAVTIALLTRTLLRWLEPVYALLFVGIAYAMTQGHALARPHLLAMPLLMAWTVELVRAREDGRRPGFWLLPVMTIWANMHGGFTLGIALACAFAAEAALEAWPDRARLAAVARSWGSFLVLAVVAAMVTPHGPQGLWFTWQVLVQYTYALDVISEWQSPNFHGFQPLELWLLGGLALVMHQGLRLPPMRLLLLLGLIHMALKHARYIEMLGLLAPLVFAPAFAAQWRERRRGKAQFDGADRFFEKLAAPAGPGAILLALVLLVAIPSWMARARPLDFGPTLAPTAAIQAAKAAGVSGPVLNSYGSGGYLAFAGIPSFIDGRSDMYGDAFLRQYREALGLATSDGLQKLVDKYGVTWTLLDAGTPAVALLDHLHGWRRVYADDHTVVHARNNP